MSSHGASGRRPPLRRRRRTARSYPHPALLLAMLLTASTVASADDDADDGTCDPTSATGSCSAAPPLSSSSADPDFECRMYVAPASIPGAGLGMYSGVPLDPGELLPQSAASDIALQMVDTFAHWSRHRTWCLSQLEAMDDGVAVDPACHGFQSFDDEDFYPLHYYWEAHNSGGHLCANVTMSFVNGVGSLVNSHPGLNNVGIKPPALPQRDSDWKENDDSGKTVVGPGAGASTSFRSVQFYSTAPKSLPPYSELFADYGRRWFLDRAHEIGHVPLQEHWRRAATLAVKLDKSAFFWGAKHDELGKVGLDGELGQDLWECIRGGMVHSERLKNALPEKYGDVLKVVRDADSSHDLNSKNAYASTSTSRGLALAVLPGAVRDREWLDERGRCVDNVEPRPATVPDAGQGAFARRSFREGEVVLSSPLVPLRRGRLRMYGEEVGAGDEAGGGGKGGSTAKPSGWQLYLNYCLGHPSSSLLLYPYASGFNLLNHHRTNPNVALRWGTNPLSYTPLGNSTVESVLRGKEGKMIVDYVALREIAEGEEVLADYGEGWEEAWVEHAKGWKETHEGQSVNPKAAELNRHRKIRTAEEQGATPYPPGVTLACLIPASILQRAAKEASGGDRPWFAATGLLERRSDPVLDCDVASRSAYRPDGETYRVRIPIKKGSKGGAKDVVVSGVPRKAILFYDRRYHDDQFLEGAFRREVGVSEGMFPQRWLDMAAL